MAPDVDGADVDGADVDGADVLGEVVSEPDEHPASVISRANPNGRLWRVFIRLLLDPTLR
jgi:hypothetical protein